MFGTPVLPYHAQRADFGKWKHNNHIRAVRSIHRITLDSTCFRCPGTPAQESCEIPFDLQLIRLIVSADAD